MDMSREIQISGGSTPVFGPQGGMVHSIRLKNSEISLFPLFISMEDFTSSMGNLFVVMGYSAIVSLCLASIFIYFVHHRGD